MFVNEKLQEHLSTSSSLRLESRVIAEWNMNEANNILQVGNYRYRPTDPSSPYYLPTQSFDMLDQARYYTDATFSDIKIDGGRDNEDQPITFLSKQEKIAQLYSLEDCFQRNRPRSGINKARFFENKYTHFSNSQMSQRPRYYIPSREDIFKYWSSFRKEDGEDRGIASKTLPDLPNRNYIEDACPYIVYKNYVPANRIILKMQTGVGNVNLGPFIEKGVEIQDPFYGEENKTTPKRWKVQYLLENTWIDAIGFDENSQRSDGSPVIGSDGYVELAYGPLIPYQYKESFKFIKQLTHPSLVPDVSTLEEGEAYFVLTNTDSSGNFYMRYEGELINFPAQYGWQLIDEEVNSSTPYVTELVNKLGYLDPAIGQQIYREFQYIKGLRVVV